MSKNTTDTHIPIGEYASRAAIDTGKALAINVVPLVVGLGIYLYGPELMMWIEKKKELRQQRKAARNK